MLHSEGKAEHSLSINNSPCGDSIWITMFPLILQWSCAAFNQRPSLVHTKRLVFLFGISLTGKSMVQLTSCFIGNTSTTWVMFVCLFVCSYQVMWQFFWGVRNWSQTNWSTPQNENGGGTPPGSEFQTPTPLSNSSLVRRWFRESWRVPNCLRGIFFFNRNLQV